MLLVVKETLTTDDVCPQKICENLLISNFNSSNSACWQWIFKTAAQASLSLCKNRVFNYGQFFFCPPSRHCLVSKLNSVDNGQLPNFNFQFAVMMYVCVKQLQQSGLISPLLGKAACKTHALFVQSPCSISQKLALFSIN